MLQIFKGILNFLKKLVIPGKIMRPHRNFVPFSTKLLL